MNAHVLPVQLRSPQKLGYTIAVAHSLDQILKVIALRAAIYMAEQACPYSEEVDGNDFAGATHLLADDHGEPVGCLRLRWFADFFKIERAAVLPRYRKTGLGVALAEHAFALGSRKGYKQVLGHASPDLLPFWRSAVGATRRPNRAMFSFSGVDYLEIGRSLEPCPEAITIDTDPYVLLRPEGRWDEPGPLDRPASEHPIRLAEARR